MNVTNGSLYHLYNRGNQKQQLFFNDSHYEFFLEKVEKFLLPVVDILSWCLMPNHYHFMVHANERSEELILDRSLPICRLADGMKIIQSGYTKAINSSMDRTGNLFTQKYKCKTVDPNDRVYPPRLFHYLHWNPVEAGLVIRPDLWKYSSYNQYIVPGKEGICNRELCYQLLDLNDQNILFNHQLAELGAKDFLIWNPGV